MKCCLCFTLFGAILIVLIVMSATMPHRLIEVQRPSSCSNLTDPQTQDGLTPPFFTFANDDSTFHLTCKANYPVDIVNDTGEINDQLILQIRSQERFQCNFEKDIFAGKRESHKFSSLHDYGFICIPLCGWTECMERVVIRRSHGHFTLDRAAVWFSKDTGKIIEAKVISREMIYPSNFYRLSVSTVFARFGVLGIITGICLFVVWKLDFCIQFGIRPIMNYPHEGVVEEIRLANLILRESSPSPV